MTETNAITDAELVRYLDGELNASARAALDQRLADAPDASARLEALRRRTHRLSGLLNTANPSGPATRASADAIRPLLIARPRLQWPPYLKAAAVVALLLLGALAVPPARAWLLSRFLDRRGPVTGERPLPAAAPSTPSTAPTLAADVVYNFDISEDTFDLTALQGVGTLVVRRSAGARASADARAAGTSFLVLPGGLRIEGPANASAVYTIALPARVRVLRLQRATGVSLHTLGAAELTIDLSQR